MAKHPSHIYSQITVRYDFNIDGRCQSFKEKPLSTKNMPRVNGE